MSRSQFRILVVINQLLVFASIVVGEITDKSLPPEFRAYLGIDQSILDSQIIGPADFSDVPYWLAKGSLLLGVVAAVGLCFGKRWGRSLYLLTFLMALFATMLTDFFVNTGWTIFVAFLAGTTEGMILALAYFSHISRMFQSSEDQVVK